MTIIFFLLLGVAGVRVDAGRAGRARVPMRAQRIVLTTTAPGSAPAASRGTAPTASAAELLEHRSMARDMWRTIALSDARPRDERWDLRARARLLDSPRAAEKLADFCALKGTYYVNGLASCMVGDELVHPFESHGYAKALSLNGDGTATFRARITETACAAVERERGRVVHRGVMSKGLGFPQNLVVPQDRDTANIALRAWPPAPDAPNRVLIASGDNGTPHALDPRTLETRGPLPECVTSMAALEGKRLLAHTRYDAQRGRLVFAATAVAVNGAFGGARSVLDFLEVDEKGEVVSHVTHETDFMVAVLPACPAALPDALPMRSHHGCAPLLPPAPRHAGDARLDDHGELLRAAKMPCKARLRRAGQIPRRDRARRQGL